jgi:hypothetical protein
MVTTFIVMSVTESSFVGVMEVIHCQFLSSCIDKTKECCQHWRNGCYEAYNVWSLTVVTRGSVLKTELLIRCCSFRQINIFQNVHIFMLPHLQ